jgi:hypothetical protein
MKLRPFILLMLIALMAGKTAGTAGAEERISVDVKTVLASQESEYVDPRLSTLTRELRTVFRYSSYRLLKEDHVSLPMKETAQVPLPEERILAITPLGIEGDRMALKLVILKNKKEVFQTVIKLLNHRSLTVGGPKHKGGVLLFNISASF